MGLQPVIKFIFKFVLATLQYALGPRAFWDSPLWLLEDGGASPADTDSMACTVVLLLSDCRQWTSLMPSFVGRVRALVDPYLPLPLPFTCQATQYILYFQYTSRRVIHRAVYRNNNKPNRSACVGAFRKFCSFCWKILQNSAAVGVNLNLMSLL